MRANPCVEVWIVYRLALFRIGIKVDQMGIGQWQRRVGQRLLLDHDQFEVTPLDSVAPTPIPGWAEVSKLPALVT